MGRLAVLLCVGLLAGCAHVSVVPLTANHYPPTEQVELVTGNVNYKYESLGYIEAWRADILGRLLGTDHAATWDEVRANLIAQAKEMGATAVIQVHTYSKANHVDDNGNISHRTVLKGLAIRRLDQDKAQPVSDERQPNP